MKSSKFIIIFVFVSVLLVQLAPLLAEAALPPDAVVKQLIATGISTNQEDIYITEATLSMGTYDQNEYIAKFKTPGTVFPKARISYTLQFYNVGALKDEEHSRATLTLHYTEPQAMVTTVTNTKTGETGLQSRSDVPVDLPPNRIYNLIFEGGPNGKFTCSDDVPYIPQIGFINENSFEIWFMKKETKEIWANASATLTSTDPNPFEGWVTEGVTVNLLQGSATFLPNKSVAWSALQIRNQQSVTLNDKIKTGPNTRVELKFPDGSAFRIKSDTVLMLSSSGIQLEAGEIWFNLQKQGKTFKVETPKSICEVIGTKFSVKVAKDGKSDIALYEGSVQVSDKKGGQPKPLLIGEQASVYTNGSIDISKAFQPENASRQWIDNIDIENTPPNLPIPSPVLIILLLFALASMLVYVLYILTKKKEKPHTENAE